MDCNLVVIWFGFGIIACYLLFMLSKDPSVPLFRLAWFLELRHYLDSTSIVAFELAVLGAGDRVYVLELLMRYLLAVEFMSRNG